MEEPGPVRAQGLGFPSPPEPCGHETKVRPHLPSPGATSTHGIETVDKGTCRDFTKQSRTQETVF